MSDEWNECARAVIFARVAFLGSNDAHQSLRLACVTDGNHKSSIHLQLREQRLRHIRAARRHENRIVGSVRAPTERAVETFDGRVVDSKLTDARLRLARKLTDPLNGIDL